MKKFIAFLLISGSLFAPAVSAGEAGNDKSDNTRMAHWAIEVMPKGDHYDISFWANPDYSVQTPGSIDMFVCPTYTPTGRNTRYKRIDHKKPLDLHDSGVETHIDAKGLDRIDMGTPDEKHWVEAKEVSCSQIRDGFNILFTFGSFGAFGRQNMTWLCFKESLQRGQGLIVYGQNTLSFEQLKERDSPIYMDEYETPDGRKDGFLRIRECSQ